MNSNTPNTSATYGLVALLTFAWAFPVSTSRAKRPQPQNDTLPTLVRTYFLETNAGRRETILRRIEEASDHAFDPVADAVRTVNLWSSASHRSDEFELTLPSKQRLKVAYQLPVDYDPKNAYPMALVFDHAFDLFEGAPPSSHVNDLLGEHRDKLIVVYVSTAVGHQFFQSVDMGHDLPTLLVHLRQLMHIDVNRIYLILKRLLTTGYEEWLCAAQYPSQFALVLTDWSVSQSGTLESTFLTRNLRYIPWYWRDGTAARRVVFDRNADASMLESSTDKWFELRGHVNPEAESIAQLFDVRQERPIRKITYWFRYPWQGEVAWLKQTRFMGLVWTEKQLSARPRPGNDYVKFTDNVMMNLLAYMGAEVSGQTIEIQTRKCAQIELRLPINLVDLSRPVTIRINGRRRYSRKIKPSIRALLETAYQRWDFQNLVAARLAFNIHSDFDQK